MQCLTNCSPPILLPERTRSLQKFVSALRLLMWNELLSKVAALGEDWLPVCLMRYSLRCRVAMRPFAGQLLGARRRVPALLQKFRY